jgi:uncharacterized protein (TIGR03435 family)
MSAEAVQLSKCQQLKRGARFVQAVLLAGTLIGARPPANAQSASADQSGPVFEVATIKAAEMPLVDQVHVGIRFQPGHVIFACDYCSLGMLIEWSYDLKDYQLAGPPWLTQQSFLVEARVGPGTTASQTKQMMHALLADRFQLRFHRQQKDLPVMELVTGPKGPKLKAADPNEPARIVSASAEIKGTMSMRDLASRLSSFAHETVMDKTGISGLYEIDLRWTPVGQTDPGLPSEVFGLLSDQLGLKLQRNKMPADIFVVDSALRLPTPN